jgi:hypothetical protein
MTTQTIEEKVKWYSLLNKQNLNGRETEDELYEAGILVGIEETEELRDEFAIDLAIFVSKNYTYSNVAECWLDSYNLLANPITSEELLEIFKKEKGYE